MSSQQQIEGQILAAVSQFSASLNSDQKVIGDMSALVEATSHLPLSNLDNWERIVRQGLYLASINPKPAKWKFWIQSTPIPFLTWIDLCSGDGFRRERTLRTLSGAAPNAFFLAIAVRRLNDWVPQVRAAACEQLPSIATASKPEDVVDVLCTVFPHWSLWGRMETEGKQTLLKIASIEAVAYSLKSRLVSGTAGPLASVFAQAGQSSALDTYLLEIASNAIQPSVRAKAYQSLLNGKMVWLAGRRWEWTDIRYCEGRFKPMLCGRPLSINVSLEETLRAASVDRSALVRRIAGDILIQKAKTIGSATLQLATTLASDPHPSVAAKGNFVLKKLSARKAVIST